MCNKHNLDFDNLNAYTKFGKLLSTCSQDNGRKRNYDGRNDVRPQCRTTQIHLGCKNAVGNCCGFTVWLSVQCGAKADKHWAKSQIPRWSRWLRAAVTNNWCIIYNHLKYWGGEVSDKETRASTVVSLSHFPPPSELRYTYVVGFKGDGNPDDCHVLYERS